MLKTKLFLSINLLLISSFNFAAQFDAASFELSISGIQPERLDARRSKYWNACVQGYLNGTNPSLAALLKDKTNDYLMLHNSLLFCSNELSGKLYDYMKQNGGDAFSSYLRLTDSNGRNILHYALGNPNIETNLFVKILTDCHDMLNRNDLDGQTPYTIYLKHDSKNETIVAVLEQSMEAQLSSRPVMALEGVEAVKQADLEKSDAQGEVAVSPTAETSYSNSSCLIS